MEHAGSDGKEANPDIARVSCNVRPEGFDPFDKLRDFVAPWGLPVPSLSRGSGFAFRRVEGCILSKAR